MPKPAAKPSSKATYLDELKRRSKESHVYRKYQLIGLEISQILDDEKHKSLYIKLAKEHDGERLRRLAKDVVDRKDVRNKGAYFMRLATPAAAHPHTAATINAKPKNKFKK